MIVSRKKKGGKFSELVRAVCCTSACVHRIGRSTVQGPRRLDYYVASSRISAHGRVWFCWLSWCLDLYVSFHLACNGSLMPGLNRSLVDMLTRVALSWGWNIVSRCCANSSILSSLDPLHFPDFLVVGYVSGVSWVCPWLSITNSYFSRGDSDFLSTRWSCPA